MTRVTLLTDFGTADGYAAAMAGVIAAAAPDAIVDVASHEILPGDVLGAALALSRYWRLYPEGSVHLVVVDPGVGTSRAALAATIDGRRFIAPDNGVLTLVLRQGERTELHRIDTAGSLESASPTFHGRDIFAPAAARLAAGRPLAELGPPHASPALLSIPEPAEEGRSVRGVVLHVDRFGNLITNIPATLARTGGRLTVGATDVGPLRRTYGDVPRGALVAVVGSLGLLEASVRDGSAARRLGARRGDPVVYG